MEGISEAVYMGGGGGGAIGDSGLNLFVRATKICGGDTWFEQR